MTAGSGSLSEAPGERTRARAFVWLGNDTSAWRPWFVSVMLRVMKYLWLSLAVLVVTGCSGRSGGSEVIVVQSHTNALSPKLIGSPIELRNSAHAHDCTAWVLNASSHGPGAIFETHFRIEASLAGQALRALRANQAVDSAMPARATAYSHPPVSPEIAGITC